MFRVVCRSSSGAPTAFAASGLHTCVVTARSQVCKCSWSSWWWATYRSKHVELLMNKWNNKFRYQVASCWLFILSYTTMHGSMNIKKKIFAHNCNFYTFGSLVIILEILLWKYDGREWIGFIWVRIGTSDGLLWMRWRTLRFHRVRGISCVAEELLAYKN